MEKKWVFQEFTQEELRSIRDRASINAGILFCSEDESICHDRLRAYQKMAEAAQALIRDMIRRDD